MQITLLHTADELRQISNLAHVIEGVVLGLAAGTGLLFYLIVPHHGLSRARGQWSFVFGDPQQRQHIVFATLTLESA